MKNTADHNKKYSEAIIDLFDYDAMRLKTAITNLDSLVAAYTEILNQAEESNSL